MGISQRAYLEAIDGSDLDPFSRSKNQDEVRPQGRIGRLLMKLFGQSLDEPRRDSFQVGGSDYSLVGLNHVVGIPRPHSAVPFDPADFTHHEPSAGLPSSVLSDQPRRKSTTQVDDLPTIFTEEPALDEQG